MTKHTKHQVLGILVIIGLIVLALPLFQRHKNMSMDNPLKQPPPFPDQSMQVMAPENNDAPVITPPVSAQTEEAPPPLPSAMSASTAPEIEKKAETASVVEDAAPVAADTVKTNDSSAAETAENAVANASAAAEENQPGPAPIKPKQEKKPTPSLTPGKPVSAKSSAKSPAHSLIAASAATIAKSESKPELKSAGWVVQLGSFKNKANALRLVNKLRSNGYHAFMESSHGNITRVLVGPETKKTEAKKLADQVNTVTNLQGMIMTYKPLTL